MSHGGQLLAHPMPIQGESMYSFILRFCRKNGLPVLFLLNLLRCTDRHIQSADFRLLDISPENLISLDGFSELSGVKVDMLKRLTMGNLLQTFSDSETLSRARLLSGLIRDEIVYCPHCLAENSIYSILWRFKNVQLCTRHDAQLQDKCPACRKYLQFKDVQQPHTCPYCGATLLQSTGKHKVIPESAKRYQIWLAQSFTDLIHISTDRLSSQDIPMKLLYILNDRYARYNNAIVREKFENTRVLATLLQHARGSLKQHRTLHFNFISGVLHHARVSMKDFMALSVPPSFVDSIREPAKKFTERYACQAPWCSGYNQPGTLVKTGTSVKEQKGGNRLSTYMVCTACGCEYGINEDGDIKERTYFGQFYSEVVNHPNSSLQEVAYSLGFSNEKLNRCVAFFATRKQGLTNLIPRIEIKDDLLEQFVAGVKNQLSLKQIRKLNRWRSYKEFLMYRFHLTVIMELNDVHRRRPDRLTANDGKGRVESAIRELDEGGTDISLKSVSQNLGVCPETIRIWGCNAQIAEAKKRQRLQRIEESIERIYEALELFLIEHVHDLVKSCDFYERLGKQRSLVWRINPVITGDVTRKIHEHNELLMHQESK